MVSTHAFHLCDPGSIPAQCSYQIKIPPWSHVKSVSSLTLPNTAGFLRVLRLLDPYWTSRENSLVMTDRVIQYK